MGVTNNNKLGIDLPVWERLRDAQGGNSSAISTSCTALNPVMHINFGRYIYYLNAATSFWRYDTWTDTYMQLQSPPITPATFSEMRFLMSAGVEGNIISASANTAYIPAYFGKAFKGYDISIVAGTGAGQRRTIIDVDDARIEDMAVATNTTNTLGTINLTDSTKNWRINQWAGYQARVVQNSGVGQVRRILANSSSLLVLGDSLMVPHETFANPAAFSPAIASTAGSQTVVNIEASIVTLDNPWSIIPDTSSRYKVEGGAILLASSAAATPFYTLQQYDIITDTWYVRSAVTNNIALVGTDATIERTGDQATVWERGVATITGTTSSLTDTSKAWITNQWASSSISGSYYIRIWSGQGEGQQARILSNTATTLTFETMSVAPNSGSQYFIDGFDAGIATSGSFGLLVDSTKNWSVNRWKNYALRITSGSGTGLYVPILSNNSSSITLYGSSSIALDNTSVYTITADTDKNYFFLGNNATVYILNLADDIMTFGRKEDSGIACSGSVQFSSNKPQAIASLSNITTTATVTMAVTHSYRAGQTVTVRGATDANFNGTFTIVSVPTPLTFTYTMPGTPASTTLTGLQSQTQLSDTTKNWRVNQWANYNVYMVTSTMTAASGLVSGQNLRILSNTANTLTFATVANTAPINGVSRYIITRPEIIGSMYVGFATGSAPTTTTLQDTNTGFLGSGSITGNVLTVTLNSFTTGSLGIGSVVTGSFIAPGTFITAFGPNTFQSSSVGTYLVNYSQSAALGQISSSGWLTNFFAGRRMKILTGTGQSQEPLISSNTNNTLTFVAITTAPGLVSSSYAILQQPIRSTGVEAQWVQGNSDPNLRGRRIYVARGGAVNNFDYIDVTTDKVEVLATSPQPETLTTGTMYAYDGGDRIYFTKDATMRFYYLDVTTNQIHGAGFAPFGTGAAIIGNRMEVFTTPDGLKYLWFVKHTSAEVMRSMLYY